jgi:DNA-binding response OmpR family regulator
METSKKILVVEDEKTMSDPLSLQLRDAGFDVDVAETGASGIAALKEKTYDLVLLDILMPLMDGFTFLQLMKELRLDTPVVILSALDGRTDKEKALHLGANAYFVKSDTSISEIIVRTKEVLNVG